MDITYFEENQLVDEDFLEESSLQKVEELISALSEPENLIKESGTSQEVSTFLLSLSQSCSCFCILGWEEKHLHIPHTLLLISFNFSFLICLFLIALHLVVLVCLASLPNTLESHWLCRLMFPHVW